MSDLVKLSEKRPSSGWYLKAGLTAVILTSALIFTDRAVPLPRIFPPPTNDEDTANSLTDYFRNPSANIVLVGSSLMYRLTWQYFSLPNVKNIAIAGDNPVTGLQIVNNQNVLPKVVVVETNILERVVNTTLVDRYRPVAPLGSNHTSIDTTMTRVRPVRTAIAFWTGFTSPALNAIYVARRAIVMTETDPPTPPLTAAQIKEADGPGPIAQMTSNANEIVALAETLEKKGVRVFLVELPVADDLRNAPVTKTKRRLIQEAVGNRTDLLLDLPVDRSQLRWTDSEHLSEHSAILTIEALESALSTRLKTPSLPD